MNPFYIALTALPTTYNPSNPSPFTTFFENWGTHISTQVSILFLSCSLFSEVYTINLFIFDLPKVMGARVQITSTFDETSYSQLISSNLDVSAAASYSWGLYSGIILFEGEKGEKWEVRDERVSLFLLYFLGSISDSTSTAQSNSEYFDEQTSSVTRDYLGQAPPLNGGTTLSLSCNLIIFSLSLCVPYFTVKTSVLGKPVYSVHHLRLSSLSLPYTPTSKPYTPRLLQPYSKSEGEGERERRKRK
jgi:hypothetical protein